jgi:hypothetical protein
MGEVLPDQKGRSDRQLPSSTAVGKKAAGSAFGGPKLPVVFKLVEARKS